MTHAERVAALERALRASPRVMIVLETARALGLPDWRLVSGAVYQTVWNALTGREPDYGIKDYDLAIFDPDTSWEAEDAAIRRLAAALPLALAPLVEVRNQARVHLWFPGKFAEPYPPLPDTDAALARFVCPAFAVGVRLDLDETLSIAAPFGLEDLFALRLRRNPRREISEGAFARVTTSARARWPELTVDDAA